MNWTPTTAGEQGIKGRGFAPDIPAESPAFVNERGWVVYFHPGKGEPNIGGPGYEGRWLISGPSWCNKAFGIKKPWEGSRQYKDAEKAKSRVEENYREWEHDARSTVGRRAAFSARRDERDARNDLSKITSICARYDCHVPVNIETAIKERIDEKNREAKEAFDAAVKELPDVD